MSKYAPHRKTTSNPRATFSTVCQKCLQTGHFIYECKSTRPYVSRPSRTQQLENPRSLAKLKATGTPSVDVPEEFKNKSGTANRILEAKEKEREAESDKGNEKEKKRARRSSSSGPDSESDSSDSDSDSSDSSSSSSTSSHSHNRDHKRRKRSRSRSVSNSDSEDGRSRHR